MIVTDQTPPLHDLADAAPITHGECDAHCPANAVVAIQVGRKVIDVHAVQVVLVPTGSVLLFCGHHWRENFGVLDEMTVERWQLPS